MKKEIHFIYDDDWTCALDSDGNVISENHSVDMGCIFDHLGVNYLSHTYDEDTDGNFEDFKERIIKELKS